MVQRRGAVQRILRLDRGSYTIEGIVAIGVFFLLMLIIVQLGFLVLARNAAATSVDAALRKAAAADGSVESLEVGLVRDVSAVVPGATAVSVEASRTDASVRAVLRFQWVPPGPDLVPVTVSIERSVVLVVPP